MSNLLVSPLNPRKPYGLKRLSGLNISDRGLTATYVSYGNVVVSPQQYIVYGLRGLWTNSKKFQWKWRLGDG